MNQKTCNALSFTWPVARRHLHALGDAVTYMTCDTLSPRWPVTRCHLHDLWHAVTYMTRDTLWLTSPHEGWRSTYAVITLCCCFDCSSWSRRTSVWSSLHCITPWRSEMVCAELLLVNWSSSFCDLNSSLDSFNSSSWSLRTCKDDVVDSTFQEHKYTRAHGSKQWYNIPNRWKTPTSESPGLPVIWTVLTDHWLDN